MSTVDDAAIDALAEAAGMEASYRDTTGQVQQASAETKRATLLSMGFDLGSAGAVDEALRALLEAEWHSLIAPVTVLRRSPDTVPSVTVTLPEALLVHSLEWRLDLETGATLSGTVTAGSAAVLERRVVGGSAYARIRLPLPPEMDDGYHTLTVAAGRMEATATVIGTPPTAFAPDWLERGERRWGIACPLFSLRSDTNWGVGDFSDLAALGGIAEKLGASVIGLNPLHAPLPGEQSDPNPYLPSSRLFLDPVHIDVTRIPAPDDQPEGWNFAREPSFATHLAQARDSRLVDYPLVRRLKRDALETVYRSRQWDGAALDSLGATRMPPVDFQHFRHEHGAPLFRFAVFNALQEHFEKLPRHRWPIAFRTPESPGLAGFVKDYGDRIDYHIWLQWIADGQLAAAGTDSVKDSAGLYRDLAVGINRDGADAWTDPDIYVSGASVGAPPDAFNPAGQDWGMPPPHPLALRRTDYAAFRAAVRANMRHTQVLRIDHVMGLQRLYWIPSGLPATSGAYIRYPLDDMLGIATASGCLWARCWRTR